MEKWHNRRRQKALTRANAGQKSTAKQHLNLYEITSRTFGMWMNHHGDQRDAIADPPWPVRWRVNMKPP